MSLTNTRNRLKYLQQNLTNEKLIEIGYPVFVEHTAVKSGNAIKHTYKTTNQIVADYPYAHQLDQGKSKQHREGMVQPTIQAMREYVRKIIGR